VNDKRLGVILNGVTGRMGYRQHLVRSILAIRDDGGVELADGTRVVLDPLLVGRRHDKLAEIAERHGLDRWTTSLDEALGDPSNQIYFDAQATSARAPAVRAAVDAGKHVYAEKPLAGSLADSIDLAERARAAGIKHGVVQDKVFLPGLRKLRLLRDAGFFGRVLSIRGEFGYWVFEGDWRPGQRPSWNYRAEDGGGIVLDMFAHWSYVLELFGSIRAVTARAVTHIPIRWDERGKEYASTADDAAYAIFELDGGVVAQLNSSWCVRVNRDELVEFQVDGTDGSAVAGLHRCAVQPRVSTPLASWDPDMPTDERFRDQWQEVPEVAPGNAFRMQWERFVRHVCDDEPIPFDFFSGARGVQLAELGLRSSAEGRRVEVPDL
jgi:predicted dehydrogenase